MNDWITGEAHRCLGCFDPPCQKACPASIPIPAFIRSIKSLNLQRAARTIRDANPMAATCGAVCPEDVLCQPACTRGKIDRPIRIRELHSYASRFEEPPSPGVSSKATPAGAGRVAVIGSGPAGLSCARTLAKALWERI